MYSKTLEISGMALVALAVALLTSAAAGVLVGGLELLLIGGTTDDAAVGLVLRRSYQGVRSAYRRQVVREEQAAVSPHPPLVINPETERLAERLAAARKERAKVRDRSPALRRYEPNGDEELERLA